MNTWNAAVVIRALIGAVAAGGLLLAAGSAIAKEEPSGPETARTGTPQDGPRRSRAKKQAGHQQGTHGANRHGDLSGRGAHGRPRDHAGGEHQHAERVGKAHAHGTGSEGHDHREALTEFLFGFVTGSDIGDPGDRHLLFDLTGAFAKATGTYAALSKHVEVAFTPWQNFHVGFNAAFAYHRISGVRGLEAPEIGGLEAAPAGDEAAQEAPRLLRRDNGAFDGLGLEFRQRFLDRERAPFGLTLVVEPHWARVEETSGAPVNKHAVGLLLAADKDIVADTLFAAINVLYEPEWMRLRETQETERESTLGLSAAAMLRVAPSIYFGGDARYLRKYEGAALNSLSGEALFVGPTLFATFGHSLLLSAAFGTQVWGRAVGEPGALDLDNFTRYQAKLRLVVHF